MKESKYDLWIGAINIIRKKDNQINFSINPIYNDGRCDNYGI